MSFLGIQEAIWIALLVNGIAALAFYMTYAAGTLNVAQPGFMAMGAYAVGLTASRPDGVIWEGVLLGFVLITVLAILLSLVTIRLAGIYLAMATLAFVVVVQQVIIIDNDLHGAIGFFGIPVLLTWQWGLLVLALVALFAFTLVRSRLGYEMRIAREDTLVAQSVGIDIRILRLKTMVLSAWIAGIAGVMTALQSSFIGPSAFGFSAVILILSFAIVGGTDRWWGPLIGAAILTLLPKLLLSVQGWGDILIGALDLLVVLLFPEGIVGILLRLKEVFFPPAGMPRIVAWPWTRPVPPSPSGPSGDGVAPGGTVQIQAEKERTST